MRSGTVQPIAEIDGIARENMSFFTAMRFRSRIFTCGCKEIGNQLFSLSAHKIYGTKGWARCTFNRVEVHIFSTRFAGTEIRREQKMSPHRWPWKCGGRLKRTEQRTNSMWLREEQ
jgi:hypothetical protein